MNDWEGSQLNTAKEILAFELTKLVHGEEEALKAQTAAKALFGAGGDLDHMPKTVLTEADFADSSISVIDAMLKAGVIKSRGEGRRLIEQGGVSLDDEKVTDFAAVIPASAFEKGHVILKKGKKVFNKLVVE